MMRRVVVPDALTDTAPRLGGVVHRVVGETMGTTWSVSFVGAPGQALAPVRDGIQAVLDSVVDEMSPWIGDSAISRFNRAPAGSGHVLPTQFATVLAYSLSVAEESGGAHDPTIGALVDLWGFGPCRRRLSDMSAAPCREAIDDALARSGWHRVAFDAESRRACQPGGLLLDLSSVAKGYGVDRVADHLRGSGFDSFLVEVGGELRGEGVKPDAQPWWVALEVPPEQCIEQGAAAFTVAQALASKSEAVTETLVALHGMSVATSGDYRRWFEADGTRYSHTIDPRNGLPIRHGLASVTVLHASCMAADAWSTALNVMGLKSGLAFARQHRLAALFVSRVEGGFSEHCSDALLDLLT